MTIEEPDRQDAFRTESLAAYQDWSQAADAIFFRYLDGKINSVEFARQKEKLLSDYHALIGELSEKYGVR